MPNIGGWYNRKWKAYTPTKKEAKWGKEVWIPLIILLIILVLEIYFL